jgi:WD40 repeat protein/DNA polymerase III delta prime subunit
MTSLTSPPRVFISYARSDGEASASSLRERLEREHPEITLWQDRVRMQGGVGWWRQIADALEAAEFLVLVMTPAAVQSDTCQREWRYARQHGACVIPVVAPGGASIDFAGMPRWMRKSHFYDLGFEWDIFINMLKSPCQSARVPFMVPDLPPALVERPAIDGAVLDALLGERGDTESAPHLALRGPGGLGKTTVAIAVCHNEDVITHYDDGILWVTLGEQPQIEQSLTKLYAALTDERPAFVDVEDAAYHLADRLSGLNCLLVIDDVWNPAHLAPFLRGGDGVSRLVTTRFFDVAADMDRIDVGEMTLDQSEMMLTQRFRDLQIDRASVRELADRLDRWPLLLELAGSALANRIKRGDTPANALVYITRKLDKHGVTAFDHHNPTARHQAVASTLDASLELIEDVERQHLAELAVFPEDVSIPIEAAAAIWQLDQWETEELIEQFENLSLLKFFPQRGELQLHDLIREYLAARIDNVAELHGRLADQLEDAGDRLRDYRVRWLPYHLAGAGRVTELRSLLLSIDWLREKIASVGPVLAVDDFSLAQHDPELQLLAETIRISAYVTAQDPDQLPSQLLARLPQHDPLTGSLRRACSEHSISAWLVPLKPLLSGPGSPMVATLAGHTGRVKTAAFGPDPSLLVSGSDDGSVRIWDIERAVQREVLTGHQDWVRDVCVFVDGQRAVSVSDDHTIRVWDLSTFRCLRVIDTTFDWLRTVVVEPEGRFIYTADDSERIRKWDWQSGEQVGTLVGHSAKVNGLLALRDGRIISISDDRSVRFWDGVNDEEIGRFVEHVGRVVACAVNRDETLMVTAGSDNKICAWPLAEDPGSDVRIVTDKAQWVRDLAVTVDGKSAIAAAEDRELEVWDLATGKCTARLPGHTDWVSAVAVSPDGRFAVSSSDDHTLKIWRLGGGLLRDAQATVHTGLIRQLACSADGRTLLSAGEDRRLVSWALDTGERLASVDDLDIHRLVTSVDGERIICAEGDATVRVRDIRNTDACCEFRRHADRVRAITVSDDGSLVASSGDDRMVRVWQTIDAQQLSAFPVGTHIRALQFLDDNERLISAAVSGRIKLLRAANGEIIGDFEGHTAQVNVLALDKLHRRFFSAADDHTVRVWDLDTHSCLQVLQGHVGPVRDVACHGDWIVSVAEDASVRVWDPATGQTLAVYTGESPFTAVCWCEDGRRIIAGDRQGRVHLLEPRIGP